MSVPDQDLDLVDALEGSPIGVVVLERGSNNLLFWNSSLLEMLGGLQSDAFIAATRQALFLEKTDFEEALAELEPGDKRICTRNSRILTADGSIRWATVSLRSIMFKRLPAILGWYVDITDLRAAALDAQRAIRSQSSFLATMSHEIRTPMNGVQTIAELLGGTRLTAEQRYMVTTIKDSADALVAIVNDILDFSKIEAGRLEISPRPFRLKRVVDGVIQLLRPKAEEKLLSLTLSSLVPIDGWHLGDDMRLRQILLNLIGNAIKFTAAGSVELRIGADDIGIRFEVRDTGPGIPPEKLKELFAPFRQGDASTARNYGGTGLGLSICKQLAEMMEGAIGVDSEVGCGSTFWLSLPLPAAPAPGNDAASTDNSPFHLSHWSAPTRAVAEQKCAVVLCAEDNRTNRDVLSHLLSRLGIVFDMVENGIEAQERLDRSIHGLLLTDGHMPKMDGWELSERLRAAEAAQGLARLPIVALTADAVVGIEEKCRAAGMDGYLTKPLSIAATEAMLCRVLPVVAELRSPDEAATEAAETAATAATAEPDGAPDIDKAALDLAMLIDLVGPDFDTIDPMLEHYLESSGSLLIDLQTALEQRDAGRGTRAAHSLKSASRYVGATRLGEAAAAIEAGGKAGNLAAVADLIGQVPTMLEEVAAAIAAYRGQEKLRRMRGNDPAPAPEPAKPPPPVMVIGESAAERLLTAAEVIVERFAGLPDEADALAVRNAVLAIFEACSLQDLSGDAKRNALERLINIERRLQSAVRKSNAIVAADAPPGAAGPA
jgi:PAS domain S-box-containing protein